MTTWTSWEWSLEAWRPQEIITTILPLLQWAFWALALLAMLSFIFYSRRQKQGAFAAKSNRRLMVMIALVFALILGYQATWQLAGFARPDFVQFMKRYNRRPDNPAAKIVRGPIFDARGNILAQSDPDRPGQRWYPYGAAFCHIIGYDHPFYGLAGVEAADQASLSGITHDSGADWERFGRNLLNRQELHGNERSLTLLAQLQFAAHEAMKDRKGAVVFMDVRNGDILVLYSSPGFDPEYLPAGMFEREDKNAKFLNRALHGLYPAGSTLKVLVAAAALDQGLNPAIDCPPEGFLAGTGNRPIRDHEYYDYQRRGRTWRGHGTLNMREALAKSSNVYFARLGVQLGGDKLSATADRCGINEPWVVFDGSSGTISSKKGRFPVLTHRDQAKTAQVSIGQGDMLVTPMHMAVLAAAIGNQGTAPQPRLSPTAAARFIAPFFSAEASRQLAGMMRYAVASGTGRGADIAGLDVAGKTGTAQNPHGDDHGWFIGFAPSSQPRLAFAVVMEQGGYGSESAVPVAAAVLSKAKEMGHFSQSSSPERRASP